MRCLVSFELFPHVYDRSGILDVRRQAGEAIQRLLGTGKVESSGIRLGRRGGFFVTEITDTAEFMDLLGEMVDYARFEIEPLVSFDELGKYFEKFGQP
jgi:hypothetical protein